MPGNPRDASQSSGIQSPARLGEPVAARLLERISSIGNGGLIGNHEWVEEKLSGGKISGGDVMLRKPVEAPVRLGRYADLFCGRHRIT
jgi:hypothetical protein